MDSIIIRYILSGKIKLVGMYTSVALVPRNGQHITSQHLPEYRVISQVHEDIDYMQRMERKELTLSFHNLIKRGSVCVWIY